MDPSSSLGFGIAIGITLIFMGVLIGVICRAVLKGEMTSRANCRPINPKWVKKLTTQEADYTNRRFAKYLLGWAVLMMLGGIGAIILGIAGLGDYVVPELLVITVPMLIIPVLAYYSAYNVVKAKEKSAAETKTVR